MGHISYSPCSPRESNWICTSVVFVVGFPPKDLLFTGKLLAEQNERFSYGYFTVFSNVD